MINKSNNYYHYYQRNFDIDYQCQFKTSNSYHFYSLIDNHYQIDFTSILKI